MLELVIVTACQACASARLYPRCAALVQPSAKTRLPDLWDGRPAPKAYTLAPRSPACWVRPRRFSGVGARPHLHVWWGLNGGAVLGQLWRLACRIQVGTKPLVPRGGAGKNKGHAGVTPHGLCRDCPAPREDSVAADITASGQKRSGQAGSHGAQAKLSTCDCDKATRRANQQKPATGWHRLVNVGSLPMAQAVRRRTGP